MKEEGTVLYGPVELSVSQYYSYCQSQLEQLLEEFVKQNIITIGEEELKEYYPVVKQKEEKRTFRQKLSLAVFEDAGDGQAPCCRAVGCGSWNHRLSAGTVG